MAELARHGIADVWRGFLQPKLNGWRFIADLWTGTLYSLGGLREHVAVISRDIESMGRCSSRPSNLRRSPHAAAGHAVHAPLPMIRRYVDGELVHEGGRHLIDLASLTSGAGLSYHLFDAVLRDEPFSQRHAHLGAVYRECFGEGSDQNRVRLVPTTPLTVKGRGEALLTCLHEAAAVHVQDGYEGSVFRLDSDGLEEASNGYTHKDAFSLCAVKIRQKHEEDFKIVSCSETAKHSALLGAVRCKRLGRQGKQHHFKAKHKC